MLTFFIPPVRLPFNDFISIENPQQNIAVAIVSGISLLGLIFLIRSFYNNDK